MLLTRRRQPHPLPVSGQLVEVGTGLIVGSCWPAPRRPRPPHALEVVTHLCVPPGRHDKGRLDHDALAAAAASALGHRGRRRVWHWRLALAFRLRPLLRPRARHRLGFDCIQPSLHMKSSLGGGQLPRLHCGHSWQVSRVVGAGKVVPRAVLSSSRIRGHTWSRVSSLLYAATRVAAYMKQKRIRGYTCSRVSFSP